MARRREYSKEELVSMYQSTYLKNLETMKKVREKARPGGKLTEQDQADILNLKLRMYKPDQVVPSIKGFIQEVRSEQRKRYKKELENWDPNSGEPKPKMPKQDSIIRYAAQLANRDTRNISVRKANAVRSEGVFTTGEIKKINKKTGEITYTNISRDQLYYLSEEELDIYVWDPIRRRRQELIEENKKKGGKGLYGKLLSEYLAETIAYEFFGSDPPGRK